MKRITTEARSRQREKYYVAADKIRLKFDAAVSAALGTHQKTVAPARAAYDAAAATAYAKFRTTLVPADRIRDAANAAAERTYKRAMKKLGKLP